MISAANLYILFVMRGVEDWGEGKGGEEGEVDAMAPGRGVRGRDDHDGAGPGQVAA